MKTASSFFSPSGELSCRKRGRIGVKWRSKLDGPEIKNIAFYMTKTRLEGPYIWTWPATLRSVYFWPYSTIWANLFDTETPRTCQYWFRIGDIVSFSRSNYLLLNFNEFDLLFWREGLSIIQASKETFLNAFLFFSIKNF